MPGVGEHIVWSLHNCGDSMIYSSRNSIHTLLQDMQAAYKTESGDELIECNLYCFLRRFHGNKISSSKDETQ